MNKCLLLAAFCGLVGTSIADEDKAPAAPSATAAAAMSAAAAPAGAAPAGAAKPNITRVDPGWRLWRRDRRTRPGCA
jgi:hypothetical protein